MQPRLSSTATGNAPAGTAAAPAPASPAGCGRAGRLALRLRRSLPPLSATLAGAAFWAFTMTASALLALWEHGWQTPQKYGTIALLFASGAVLAFPLALLLARFCSLGRPAETAFASMFVALSLSTVGITAGLFALDYRRYYATWHEDVLTITWVFQLVFTTAGALVQFAVLGMRLFMPVGFAGLFLASLWFARRPR
jgi:hypothetical protein